MKNRVCRTCLNAIPDGAKFYVLGGNVEDTRPTLLRNQLKACIPELSLEISQEPVICSTCVVSLITAFEFRSKCARTEGKIKRYSITNCLTGPVDLLKVADAENSTNRTLITEDDDPTMRHEDEITIKTEPVVESETVCEETAAGHMVFIKSEDPLPDVRTPAVRFRRSSSDSDADDPEYVGETDARKKVYRCGVCERLYTNRAALEAHVNHYTACKRERLKRRRADEGPHACKRCSGRFPTATALNEHMRARHVVIQTGSRYGCKTCGREFKWKAYLMVHQRKHRTSVVKWDGADVSES